MANLETEFGKYSLATPPLGRAPTVAACCRNGNAVPATFEEHSRVEGLGLEQLADGLCAVMARWAGGGASPLAYGRTGQGGVLSLGQPLSKGHQRYLSDLGRLTPIRGRLVNSTSFADHSSLSLKT